MLEYKNNESDKSENEEPENNIPSGVETTQKTVRVLLLVLCFFLCVYFFLKVVYLP